MRKIIHIDMDCFYAQVEERDDPRLRGRPIAVGGQQGQRSVLCTCNYIARQFGCHAAMATSHALKRCPELIIIPPQFDKYKQISNNIKQIYEKYTEIIEPLSLDEAYLDVSENTLFSGSATHLATQIRKDIYAAEGLTASAGISVNKFLAKVASDWHKPNGQFVVPPESVDVFVKTLPVKKIFGVGKVTARKLEALGIETCADLQAHALTELVERFGKFGMVLYELARGQDDRPVCNDRQRLSLSVEQTYARDLLQINCQAELSLLFVTLQRRLAKPNVPKRINKQFVKIKFDDFKQTTVESNSSELSLALFARLLTTGLARKQNAVRLLGIGVRFPTPIQEKQLRLHLS